MTIYSCEHRLDAMLTCIFEAWSGHKGYQNISLRFEPIEQYTLFDEYIHVEADEQKASKVMNTVSSGISPAFYSALAYSAMSSAPDTLDNIYHLVILGFKFGPSVLDMTQYKDVMRNMEIRRALGNEIHHFIEFVRFHAIADGVYVAHIEPKSPLVGALGDQFSDRMPSEHWMIIDDIHKQAIIHPKDEDFYLRYLTDDEFDRLLKTEDENDQYTDLWKVFFDSIAIKQRANERCQTNLFPKWTRKHAVEFIRP